MTKYPPEKIQDHDFFYERKNEFYPDDDYGNFAFVCPECHEKIKLYYLNKIIDFDT